MTLSSSDLIISHLTPGNYASSNTITVNVSTNNSYGYTLIAKVGDKDNPSLSNNNLVNTESSDTTFTSLSTTDNITLPNFNDNKWGYTTASNIDTNITTYSGLLYNADTIINATKSSTGIPMNNTYPGTNTTNFTIAAKAGQTQASGEYTNVINFRSVANVSTDISITDLTYMQDIAKLTDVEQQILLSSMVEDQQYQLKDKRDNNIYYVAKLKDGNIWMTQNLDLCIGCSGTVALTSENTDLNQYDTNGDGTGTVFYGYSKDSNNVITWTPNGTTVAGSPATISDFSYSGSATTAVSGWTNDYNHPYMAEGKSTVSYGGTSNIYANVAACVAAGYSELLCKHNQYGNYYNWSAAVAMNDTSMYDDNSKYTVAPNSICPAGWRLPKGLTQTSGTVNISEFNSLLNRYGIAGGNDTAGSTNVGYEAGGFNKLVGDPLFMTRAGFVYDTTLYISGARGYYWSSTVVSASQAYYLYFASSGLYPANQSNRDFGRSVRCVFK